MMIQDLKTVPVIPSFGIQDSGNFDKGYYPNETINTGLKQLISNK